MEAIGAILGALLSAGAGIAGAQAETKTAATNWAINEANRRDRNKERQQTIDEAQKTKDEQHLGSTNAAGDSTHFVKGKGWVTDLGPLTQDIQDNFYSNELPAREAAFNRNDERSRQENDVANALLNEFRRVQKVDPTDTENQLFAAATRGIGENTRDVAETAARAGLRSGSSNTGKMLGDIFKQGAAARSNAAMDAKLQAGDYANQQYQSQRSNLGQLYQLFAGRAGQDLGLSIDPNVSAGGANDLMSQASQLSANSSGQLVNATGKQGGSYDYIEPNMGPANALGAVGASLTGLGDRLGGQSQQSSMQDMLMKYMTAGGQLDPNRGALFGAISDRVRTSGGGVF